MKRIPKDILRNRTFKTERPTKPDLRRMEESIADIYLTSGRIISKGIPWNEFSEIEIQGILKIHFEELGYDVTWRHRDDPANEGGIDLECRRKVDSNIVVLAFKKKPRKEALAQVLELSDEEANKRVFVYVGGASQSFRDKLSRFKSRVEFWNEEKLEEQLSISGLTLSLKTDNSSAAHAMFAIMRNLVRVINTRS